MQTSTTFVTTSPYRDLMAGGEWPCGSMNRWGDFKTRQYKQDCAACPPCTQDRMGVRNAIRDSWRDGCCNSEEYLTAPTWPYNYRGARGTNQSTVAAERAQHGARSLEPMKLKHDMFIEKYATANLAMKGTMPLLG